MGTVYTSAPRALTHPITVGAFLHMAFQQARIPPAKVYAAFFSSNVGACNNENYSTGKSMQR